MTADAPDDQAVALSLLGQPLDRSSGLSLAAQLSWRLRRLMGAGDLAAGARLPSARDLARAVGVNVNTVFAVYGRLEQEGLIESRQGRGSFVRPGAARAAALIALADETAAAARAAGLDPRDVAMSVFVAPEQAPGTGAADSALDERRRLRAEIASLEHRLAELQPLAPAPGDSRAGPAPRLQGNDELRATRDALRERVAALSANREELYAEARWRRASAHSSTLDHASGTRDRTSEAASAPLRVRWTPAWRAT